MTEDKKPKKKGGCLIGCGTVIFGFIILGSIINVVEEVVINQYMIPNGMYSSINKVKITILLTAFLACIPLIKIYGIIGAAIANLISEIVGLIYLLKTYNKTKMLRYKTHKF